MLPLEIFTGILAVRMPWAVGFMAGLTSILALNDIELRQRFEGFEGFQINRP